MEIHEVGRLGLDAAQDMVAQRPLHIFGVFRPRSHAEQQVAQANHVIGSTGLASLRCQFVDNPVWRQVPVLVMTRGTNAISAMTYHHLPKVLGSF